MTSTSTPWFDRLTADGTSEGGAAAPDVTAEADEDATAEAVAVRALAARGITAHRHPDDAAGDTRLVIGRHQTGEGGLPLLSGPYLVIYLYSEADYEEITVTRPPVEGDRWEVIAGDGTGAECTLITRPAALFVECVEAIAEWVWVDSSLPTAGAVLRAALAKRGVTVHTDGMSPSYAIALEEGTSEMEVYSRPHLLVADHSPSVEHDPAGHTGWTVALHDGSGEPVGEPLYTGGDGRRPVDCTADSEAAAAFIADWLTARRR
ncbi:hypothetical protein AB0B04_32270 [Streptomyces xinghaiensis]|uniref:Uncharacterized protein n=1 Tax=Streptomyces xinghaiensis TaxID=1038928 RepID=A0A3M8EWP2_9ACTN|nr:MULTISPECIES: hypothetical protein [Streptomyces]OFA50982.1 hypothetical protein BEN35_15275 [Streptomyces fradiae]PQM19519.1 hypothetical protein Sfr7A_31600 [Streptomyces xinghaiensis]RKM90943.1 hypothetical protein SFRA_030395 [Streptomyces xinghaiensis]RNC68944.1 hypothetical protein DC095_030640 [Streptomyces xinghaiensis]